ncbi:MAG: mechanosensitive ion channel [Bacteroidaceae bacterium]|nr:mechanosensitive ion channel [Bacteroidaceae bacterium]
MRHIFFLIVFAVIPFFSLSAQNIDSLKAVSDSVIQALQNKLQEEQLNSIIMREQLERIGLAGKADSLRIAERKARIDSLRQITPGVPLVIDDDTLFILYAHRGGLSPETRVEQAREMIIDMGKKLTFFADSVYVFESEYSTDIMAGEEVLLSLTDMDGLWQNTTRQQLAESYSNLIQDKVQEIHKDYGLQQKLLGLLLVIIVIVAQIFLIKLANWIYHKWRLRWTRKLLRWINSVKVKDYEVLNTHRTGIAFLLIFRVLRMLFIVLLFIFSIPLMFSAFPETKRLAYTLLGYIWNPVTDIFQAVIGFLPNFFKIIVIILCIRYLVKGFRYLTNEIASGNLKISGFYPDWAEPTFYILRVLCYSFMLVMIWPLLPSSNSEIFQGVSVFIGIIVSLGSTSIVGNVMAGLVMTYMRPFRIGDLIRYGEIEGYVIEKSLLVTRIRTRKNDIITIPNSNLMNSQTSNYTLASHSHGGIIVHTKVTIGYDMKWQTIRDLLLAAADATPGIKKNPKPYVNVTALDDFYVEYEINGFTNSHETLPVVYSTLHQNILDQFHTAGVEIMSPHIFAHRSDLPLQIPEEDQPSKG